MRELRTVLASCAMLILAASPPAGAQPAPTPGPGLKLDAIVPQTGAQIRIGPPPGGGGGGGGVGQPAPTGRLVTSLTPNATVQLMKEAGFSSLETWQFQNDTHVRAGIEGTQTVIWHENCSNGNCVTLWFMAFFGQQDSIDQSWINAYNLNTLYSKMFLNNKGEVVVTMGASVYKGVTEDHVKSLGPLWIEVFKGVLAFDPKK